MEQRKNIGDQVRDETRDSDQFSDQWRDDTRIRRMAGGGTPKNTRPFIGDEEAVGLA